MNWHHHKWPSSLVCVCVCVSECVCIWDDCNHELQVVSQLMFPFSPSCSSKMLSHSSHMQTAPSLTHTHTHTLTHRRIHMHSNSLTLRHTWQHQILLDASIKRKSFCFVSTVAVVQPNSSILSSSISHGCEIREMETAFAAQSKKIFKVSSWGF